jgi:AraC-like DNA-binding protein
LSWAEGIKTPLVLSVIPFFFLFISAAVTGNVRPWKQVLNHLAPPIVFMTSLPLIIFLAYLNGNIFTSGNYLNMWSTTGHVFLVLQTIFYTLMFFLKFRVYSRRLQEYYHKHPGSIIKLRNLLIAFLGFFLLLDSWLMSFFLPEEGFPIIYSLLMFVTAGITGWFGLNLEIRKNSDKIEVSLEFIEDAVPEQMVLPMVSDEAHVSPVVLELIPKVEVVELAEQITEPEGEQTSEQFETDVKPKRKSGISRRPFDEQQKKALYKRMLNHLITNELYTDSKLTLKQLANDLGTNTRYLSMVINEFQGRNFNQMLNYYRVKKVMRLLVDNEAESYSYLGLAQKAGFHSKSVFIAAFKSQTGTTPSEFSGTMKKLIKA